MQKLLKSNQFITLTIYLVILLTLRLVNRGIPSLIHMQTLYFILGLIVGTQISFVDNLVYAYFSEPEAEFSLAIKTYIKNRDFRGLYKFLKTNQDQPRKMATNNVLFLFVWVVLGLFVITSAQSGFSRGIILGIGLSLATNLYRDFSNKELLKQRLFWPIARTLSDKETNTVIYFFWGAFAFLSLMGV